METKILDINIWNTFIHKKKKKIINNIEKNNSFDKSKESIIFNSILKEVSTINIFNISYIVFMLLKLLETSVIPSYLILNIINVYTNAEMYEIIINNKTEIQNKNEKNKKENKNSETIDTYAYFNVLKLILNIIIEFVIKIELSLNIQCILMIHFIDKLNTKNIHNNNNTIYNKPKFFNLFKRTHKIATTYIKSSTLILLFFKFIRKLSIIKYDSDIVIKYININTKTTSQTNELNMNYINYMINKKEINKKTKSNLDTFMIDITHYLEDTLYINNPNIYIICSNYIINNIKLIIEHFLSIIKILEIHLLNSNTITIEKRNKIGNLKIVIHNLLDIEFNNIQTLFNVS